jgi:hypothetical protein
MTFQEWLLIAGWTAWRSGSHILFFPVDNPRLLVMLQTLLDNRDAPRKVWRD